MFHIDKENISWRLVEGEMIILNVETGDYFTLEGTGALIWEGIAQGKTEAQIVSHLISTYAVNETVARADVSDFIKQLIKSNLISIKEA